MRELNCLRDSKEYIHAAESRDARQVEASQAQSAKAQSHASPLLKAPSDKVLFAKASSASVKSPRPNAQSTKSRVKGVSIYRSFGSQNPHSCPMVDQRANFLLTPRP